MPARPPSINARWPLAALLGIALGGCGGDPAPGPLDAALPGDRARADTTLPREAAPPDPDGLVRYDGPAGDGPPGDSRPAPDAAVIVDNTRAPWLWYEQGSALADRDLLGLAFASAGYAPPAGTYLLAARVVPGVGQPAVELFSLGDTGFEYSANRYWPASTVKVMAAVGALWTLGDLGLTGAAAVSFSDDDGVYSGTVAKLYDAALEVSDNVAYNRLMEIAGFTEINEQYLVPAQGLPKMILQRRYTHPLPGSNLRTSPEIAYAEGSASGTIPLRVGQAQYPACPDEGNCVTLFELLDILRRVTLHDELPAADRFPLADADVVGLRAALLAAPNYIEPGASAALGHAVEIYNKTGAVWTDDRLDHGLIVDTVTGQRYLLAWSMPYGATSAAVAAQLSEEALRAIAMASFAAPAMQRDAGIPLTINVQDDGPGSGPGTRAHTITVAAPGADAVELWLDNTLLPAPAGPSPHFALTHAVTLGGERLLVVRAFAQNQPIGHRAAVAAFASP